MRCVALLRPTFFQTNLTRILANMYHFINGRALTNFDELGTIADALEKGICKYIVKSDMSIDTIVQRVAEDIK